MKEEATPKERARRHESRRLQAGLACRTGPNCYAVLGTDFGNCIGSVVRT